jgi:hypothetical protein
VLSERSTSRISMRPLKEAKKKKPQPRSTKTAFAALATSLSELLS